MFQKDVANLQKQNKSVFAVEEKEREIAVLRRQPHKRKNETSIER